MLVNPTESSLTQGSKLDEVLRGLGGKPVGEASQQNEPPTTPDTPPATPPPADPPPAAGNEPPKTPEPPAEWKFDLSGFNKLYGTEFESEDSIKSSLKSVTEIPTLREQLKELELIKAKNAEYEQAIDPRSHFVSDAEYKRQVILQKFPDKNPEIVGKIATIDLDKADNLDLLATLEMLETPNMVNGMEGAKEVVMARLGLDGEPSEWTTLQQNRLLSEANKARKELKQYQDVKLPDKPDFAAQKLAKEQEAVAKAAQLKSTWSPVTKSLMDNFNTFDIPLTNEKGEQSGVFSFQVPAEFKKDFVDHMTKYMVDNNLPFTDENVQKAMQYRNDVFLLANYDKILKAYGKQRETEVRDELHKQVHNPAPVNSNERPHEGNEQSQKEVIDYATFKDRGGMPSMIGKT